MRRTRTWVLRIFGIVSLLLIAGWAVEYAQQWVLRWRAESLLADVKQFQIGQSSWEDAQRFMRKWGRWGEYEGTCDVQGCSYRVVIRHIVPFGAEYGEHGRPIAHLARLTDHLGLRTSAVIGEFELYRGTITDKAFGMEVNLPARDWLTPEGALIPDLVVSSSSGSTLRGGARERDLALHPNRRYLYFKEPDYILAVRFTPQETPAEQAALMDFRLFCLTKWVACRSRGDILHGAFEEYEGELHALIRDGPGRELPIKCPPDAASREAFDVFVGDVVRPDAVQTQRGRWPVVFRVDEIVKGHAPVPVGTEFAVGLPLSLKERMQKDKPLRLLLAGDAEGQLYVSENHQGKIFLPEDCGIFEASEGNLQAARQGSVEDIGPRPDRR